MEATETKDRVPEIREEQKASAETQRMVMPRNVSAPKKKEIRAQTIWPVSALYVDRAIEVGGYNSYARDGREHLPVNAQVVKSLLRHCTIDANKGRAWADILPTKVTIAGTDDRVLLVVLNGRQRLKAADFLNRTMAFAYGLWRKLDGNRVVLKNTLVSQAQAAANGVAPDEYKDLAMFDEEDIEYLVGGRVNGEAVPGLLTKGKDTEDGPIEFCVKVDFQDIDPNRRDALRLALAERISVDTPPTVEARNIQRLLEDGMTPESVSAELGCDRRSLYNKLLVLKAEPEVQVACDEGWVSFRALREKMFTSSRTPEGRVAGGLVPRSREAQLIELEKLRHASNKFESAAIRREGATPPAAPSVTGSAGAAVGSSVGPAHGIAGVPGTAPTGAPPAAAPVPVRSKQHHHEPGGILALLPRASAAALRRVEELPAPDRDVDDGATYFAKKVALSAAKAAAGVLAFLGGDSAALDDMPEVKEIVTDAMAEAEADEAPATDVEETSAEMTPLQRAAAEVVALFTESEAIDADERPAWPDADEASPEARELLGKIQAAYVEAGASGDKGDFAREHLINLL